MSDNFSESERTRNTDSLEISPQALSALQTGIAEIPVPTSNNDIARPVLNVLNSGRDLSPWQSQIMRRIAWMAPAAIVGCLLTSLLLNTIGIKSSTIPFRGVLARDEVIAEDNARMSPELPRDQMASPMSANSFSAEALAIAGAKQTAAPAWWTAQAAQKTKKSHPPQGGMGGMISTSHPVPSVLKSAPAKVTGWKQKASKESAGQPIDSNAGGTGR